MNQPAPKHPRPLPLLLASTLLPAILFLTYTAYSALNYPLLDDYDAALNFANHLVQLPTFPERFSYSLAALHNQHKLYLNHDILRLEPGSIHIQTFAVRLFFAALVLWRAGRN